MRIEVGELRDAGEQVVALLTFHARGRDGLEVRRQFGNVWRFHEGLGLRLQAYADWSEALEAAGLRDR